MKKSLIGSGFLLVGLVMALSFFAHARPWRGHYGPAMMWDGGGGPWLLGPLMMLVFWGIVIAALVFAFQWLAPAGAPVQPGETPLDILKERFARGEIDKEEFELRRQVLGQ